MEIQPGVRRGPPPQPLPEPDAGLVALIRDEILDRGPMTFARYMELALYHPERGYYRGERSGPGRGGDFLTAPETHPIFGHALSRVLVEMWVALDRPSPFVVREYGAGSGALALAILEGLRADASPLLDAIRYDPVELGEARLAVARERLGAAGFGGLLLRPDGRDPAAGRLVGCILANEFLDALPVHRVDVREGELRELYVDWEALPEAASGGRFVDAPGPPSTPALGARLAVEGITLAEGQRGEICLAIEGWVAEAAATLERGFVLVVDYGHPADALYAASRADGTLRAYVAHRVGADPYAHTGRADLTAHVDVTALLGAATRAGLLTLGVTTQAELLVGAGVGELLAAAGSDPTATLPAYVEMRASVMRMLDPAAMGRFAAVVLGKGVPRDVSLAALERRVPGA